MHVSIPMKHHQRIRASNVQIISIDSVAWRQIQDVLFQIKTFYGAVLLSIGIVVLFILMFLIHSFIIHSMYLIYRRTLCRSSSCT